MARRHVLAGRLAKMAVARGVGALGKVTPVSASEACQRWPTSCSSWAVLA